MTRSGLSGALIFALLLAAPVGGQTNVDSPRDQSAVKKPRAQSDTTTQQPNEAEPTRQSVGTRSNPVVPGGRIDSDNEAKSGFWSTVALTTSALLALLLVASSHFWLRSRVNQLDRALEVAYRRLDSHESELASPRDKHAAAPPVTGQTSLQSSPSSDHNVPMRGAVGDPYADTWRDLPPRSPPPPPVSRLADTAEELRGTIAAMIGDPGMRASAYDAELAQFGTIWGLEIGADGQAARLVAASLDASRRLIAILLKNEQEVIIVPSSRFVKDFAMTFKGILEAGPDTKTVFDCRTDGTGILRVNRLATGQVDGSTLRNLQKGDLSGFVG